MQNTETGVLFGKKEDIKRIMTNGSGAAVTRGDVVVLDTSVGTGDGFTTTTLANNPDVMGVVTDYYVADGAIAEINTGGSTIKLKVNGTADIRVGDYLTTYTSAGISAKSGGAGFAVALEAYATNDSLGVIDAYLFPRATSNVQIVTATDSDLDNADTLTFAFGFEPSTIVLKWSGGCEHDTTNERGITNGETTLRVTAADTVSGFASYSTVRDNNGTVVFNHEANDSTNAIKIEGGTDATNQATSSGVATYDTTGGASEHLLTITFTHANCHTANNTIRCIATAYR